MKEGKPASYFQKIAVQQKKNLMTGASGFLLEYFGDPRDTQTTLDVNKTDYRRPKVSLDRSKLLPVMLLSCMYHIPLFSLLFNLFLNIIEY